MRAYRAPADHVFHVSQLHIVLDRTGDLLENYATNLRDQIYDPNSYECVPSAIITSVPAR
jgi:hypothetical protein